MGIGLRSTPIVRVGSGVLFFTLSKFLYRAMYIYLIIVIVRVTFWEWDEGLFNNFNGGPLETRNGCAFSLLSLLKNALFLEVCIRPYKLFEGKTYIGPNLVLFFAITKYLGMANGCNTTICVLNVSKHYLVLSLSCW
jgi:hypothetical protein